MADIIDHRKNLVSSVLEESKACKRILLVDIEVTEANFQLYPRIINGKRIRELSSLGRYAITFEISRSEL